MFGIPNREFESPDCTIPTNGGDRYQQSGSKRISICMNRAVSQLASFTSMLCYSDERQFHLFCNYVDANMSNM